MKVIVLLIPINKTLVETMVRPRTHRGSCAAQQSEAPSGLK